MCENRLKKKKTKRYMAKSLKEISEICISIYYAK